VQTKSFEVFSSVPQKTFASQDTRLADALADGLLRNVIMIIRLST
jgi:hypothetical protein